ncbi:NAD-P-binding protein [Stereum hirsutum FP-91666 SS1]|uniref:NAD-P-binding protein n=1 Tax=Stereum hirsutum (strain FP-91666) TaxID=721885 RepID=UPI000440F11C|nr:NAD-P-binding protein [Stereum hirsutum FP-91666 SS1]EIM89414.1 NAD-P-binding protein [Stereum hirsutum FP-91666 SS1]
MSHSSNPKTIFITGASSGIGLASALLFHSRGWNVVATMRSPSRAPSVLSSLAISDESCILITRLDVTDYDSIEPAIKSGVDRFGKIDVLLNNAGYGQQGLFEAISREKVKEQFNVNLYGVMDVTRLILPHFRQHSHSSSTSDSGSQHGIVNVSSGAGFWGLPISTLYTSSKFALEGFTESLSYELASQRIFRAGSEMPAGDDGKGLRLSDYDTFMEKTNESYKRMVGGVSISSEDVARKILEAVTDGFSDDGAEEETVSRRQRLRYWVGNDARGFVKARYASKDDEEYMGFMRGYFQ